MRICRDATNSPVATTGRYRNAAQSASSARTVRATGSARAAGIELRAQRAPSPAGARCCQFPAATQTAIAAMRAERREQTRPRQTSRVLRCRGGLGTRRAQRPPGGPARDSSGPRKPPAKLDAWSVSREDHRHRRAHRGHREACSRRSTFLPRPRARRADGEGARDPRGALRHARSCFSWSRTRWGGSRRAGCAEPAGRDTRRVCHGLRMRHAPAADSASVSSGGRAKRRVRARCERMPHPKLAAGLIRRPRNSFARPVRASRLEDEEQQPHHVDEVPVPRGRLEREVVGLVEVPA